MIRKIKSFFKKKQKPTPLPPVFGLIDFTNSAKLMGVGGEENKIIKIFRGAKEVRTEPYTEIRVTMLRYVEGIPIEDLTQGTDHPKLEWYHTTNPAIVETHKF